MVSGPHLLALQIFIKGGINAGSLSFELSHQSGEHVLGNDFLGHGVS